MSHTCVKHWSQVVVIDIESKQRQLGSSLSLFLLQMYDINAYIYMYMVYIYMYDTYIYICMIHIYIYVYYMYIICVYIYIYRFLIITIVVILRHLLYTCNNAQCSIGCILLQCVVIYKSQSTIVKHC